MARPNNVPALTPEAMHTAVASAVGGEFGGERSAVDRAEAAVRVARLLRAAAEAAVADVVRLGCGSGGAAGRGAGVGWGCWRIGVGGWVGEKGEGARCGQQAVCHCLFVGWRKGVWLQVAGRSQLTYDPPTSFLHGHIMHPSPREPPGPIALSGSTLTSPHPPVPPTCTPPPKVLPTLTEVEAAVKGAAEQRRLEAAELELEIEGYKVVAL